MTDRGIDFRAVATQAGKPDADPFDLLCYLAFNAPVLTRRQRADQLKKQQAAFFTFYAPEAREILNDLLEKYAADGELQFTLPDVLKVPPISERGNVNEIIAKFGGADQLRTAVKQTSETALLFLQLIMRKLRRQGGKSRAAVVVPNGTLFGDGVCARIKEELLKEFNLHTIVRLPNGVFAPYTGIPTNILFFDRSGPTKETWYYEQPLPEGKKNYTKTAPIQFEEFTDCINWWPKRKENDQAWKVSAAELLASGCNLDRKNPRAKEDITHLSPEHLAESILQKEQRIAEIMGKIQKLLATHGK